jgi:tetratricopeptide (TPR) repeat protein
VRNTNSQDIPCPQANGQAQSYSLGIECYRQGQYAQAIDLLKGLQAGKDLCARIARYYTGMSHRQIGMNELQLGQYDLAAEHFRQAIAGIGRNTALDNYLAGIYAKTGKYQQCLAQLEQASPARQDNQDHPDASDAIVSLALAQWHAGRRAEAYMTLTAALRGNGASWRLNYQLGLFYASEEHYDQARPLLNRALQADCGNVAIVYHLGLIAAAQRDFGSAVRHLQRAFELQGDDVMLAYQLALAGKAADQAGLPVKLRIGGQSPSVHLDGHSAQLAKYLCSEADFVDAFLALPASAMDEELFTVLHQALELALLEHPTFADLHLHCSRTLHRLGRIDQAILHARQAVEINPNYTKALIHLAHLEQQDAQTQTAIEHLARAIKCGADWPDVHATLGDWLAHAGQSQLAQRHQARATELNPKYAKAGTSKAGLAA